MRKLKLCKGKCTTPIENTKQLMEMVHHSESMVTFRAYMQTPHGESTVMEWEPMSTAEVKAIYNLITTKDE
jgi:hypothetical protein